MQHADTSEPNYIERIRRLRRLARLLDARFGLPGTPWQFGLDSVLGLIPGIGDTATAAISGYIVVEAYRMGVPTLTLARMVWNIAVDLLIGSIPVLGDIFDVVWKANLKNIELIERHFAAQYGGARSGSTDQGFADAR